MKNLLLASLLFLPSPLFAHNRINLSECYEIKEQYHEGYHDSYGNYVRGYVSSKRINVQCGVAKVHHQEHIQTIPVSHTNYNKTPQCIGNTTLGGLLGGGLAASLSEKDAYGWSIPLGAILGAGLGHSGCQ